VGPLLSTRLNVELIADCWGDLLRTAGSLKYGQATASLIVGKWSAASRQNTLAAALKEWGTLRRTIHAAKYLSDPAYRRKISRQLNKGESLHALRRDLHYANQGTIGKAHLEQQAEQAWCLTVLTNAVVTRSSPTSRRLTARTSTSSAPSPWTSRPSWRNSTHRACGPCARWLRRRRERGRQVPPVHRSQGSEGLVELAGAGQVGPAGVQGVAGLLD
jgi:hypothetical protein